MNDPRAAVTDQNQIRERLLAIGRDMMAVMVMNKLLEGKKCGEARGGPCKSTNVSATSLASRKKWPWMNHFSGNNDIAVEQAGRLVQVYLSRRVSLRGDDFTGERGNLLENRRRMIIK